MVKDHDIGNDRVRRTLRPRDLALAHPIADHLAAAEFHLLTINGEIVLDADQQRGIAQANAVTLGGTEHAGISGAGHATRHGQSAPITSARKPITTRLPA